MTPFLLFFLVASQIYTSSKAQTVWINMGQDRRGFEDFVEQSGGQTMADLLLNHFEQQNVEQQYLLSKVDDWNKGNFSAQKTGVEINDLKKSYVFSASNRLILFEHLKTVADTNGLLFQSLCEFYANDPYLKTNDPFFEASCPLRRISIKELNPLLMNYDFLLVDGNRIDLKQSPYFFSSGTIHQFKFISNRYSTFETLSTVASLKKVDVPVKTWVEGSCDDEVKYTSSQFNNNRNGSAHLPLEISSLAMKAYFSKACTREVATPGSFSRSFLYRSRYYILSGFLLALVLSSVSNEYTLAFSMP